MPIKSFARSMLVLLVVSTQANAQDAAGWVLGLSVTEAYDTNVRFRSEGLPNEIESRLTASLTHGWRGPRHAFTLTGSGTQLFFKERSERNRFTYAAGATLGQQLSSRVGLTLSDRYTDALTNQVDDFSDEGLIFSLTRTRRNRAAAELRFVLTPRTALALDGRHDLWDFEDPALENGWRVTTGAGLSHRFNERQTGSLSYSYSRNQRTQTAGEAHTGLLDLSQTLGSRWRTQASIGISQSRQQGQSATRLNWGAGLGWRFERGTLAASYSRRARTSFGLDRQRIVDALRLDLSLRLTRTLGASLLGGYARSSDPFDPTFTLDSQNYGAALTWAISPGLSLASGYAYQRRLGDVDLQDAHRASVSLGYRKAF